MSAISPRASDSRTDGTLSAITQSPIVGCAKARLRAVPTIFQNHCAEWWARFRLRSLSYGGQVALPTLRNLRELRFHRAQPVELHLHAVARIEPHGFHQTACEHDLPGMQSLALFGEMIGKPGECVVGMAEHVGAG